MKKKFLSKILLLILHSLLFTVLSCSNSSRIIIWTDRPEIVSYAEFFNVTQDKSKAVVVYKEKLASSLPPAKDEQAPDIVIGSFLRNSRIKKNFSSLNRLFNRRINSSSIYFTLLEYGKVGGRQYLIPVSFNIPTIIFSHKNHNLVSDDMLIDSDKIRDTAALFNQKTESGVFVKMGFAPSWDENFIFHVAKMNGAEFGEKGTVFSWNANSLSATVDYIKKWSLEKNDSTQAEQDFSFKYLYTPSYKLVDSDRCLFAYTKSDIFFDIPSEQTESISFRWLSKDEKIFVNDDITSLALYRKAKNKKASYDFISWFFSETTQKNLLERAMRMNLDTQTFGICAGFSSIKSVNERVFPSFYKTLLGKMPEESSLVAPLPLPARWESLKERVIIPYLIDATNTDSTAATKSIEERITAWRNQFN